MLFLLFSRFLLGVTGLGGHGSAFSRCLGHVLQDELLWAPQPLTGAGFFDFRVNHGPSDVSNPACLVESYTAP